MSSSPTILTVRHDPTDTEVSGPKWAVCADPGAQTALWKNTATSTIALTVTRGQYCQIRRDLANLEQFGRLEETKKKAAEASFEESEVKVAELVSTMVEEAPNAKRKNIRVQCLATVRRVTLPLPFIHTYLRGSSSSKRPFFPPPNPPNPHVKSLLFFPFLFSLRSRSDTCDKVRVGGLRASPFAACMRVPFVVSFLSSFVFLTAKGIFRSGLPFAGCFRPFFLPFFPPFRAESCVFHLAIFVFFQLNTNDGSRSIVYAVRSFYRGPDGDLRPSKVSKLPSCRRHSKSIIYRRAHYGASLWSASSNLFASLSLSLSLSIIFLHFSILFRFPGWDSLRGGGAAAPALRRASAPGA